MKRKTIAIALLALASLGMEAETRNGKPEFELRKHEFSISGAFAPTRFIGGYQYDFRADNDLLYNSSLTSTNFDAYAYSIEKISGYWSLNYFYNFDRAIALGASFSYEGGSEAHYKRSDDSLINKERKNILTTMAYLRASWLNLPYVRMYSLLGLGASYSMEKDFSHPLENFAFQFSPVGISVGKDLFGYIELGIGTCYSGANIGIGYRF